jgi:hypothetical protein
MDTTSRFQITERSKRADAKQAIAFRRGILTQRNLRGYVSRMNIARFSAVVIERMGRMV